MEFSNHASQRMKQRGLAPELARLAVSEGIPLKQNLDRILISPKRVHELQLEGKYPSKLLKKAEKAAPFVCVCTGESIITMFRANRRLNRRHCKKGEL